MKLSLKICTFLMICFISCSKNKNNDGSENGNTVTKYLVNQHVKHSYADFNEIFTYTNDGKLEIYSTIDSVKNYCINVYFIYTNNKLIRIERYINDKTDYFITFNYPKDDLVHANIQVYSDGKIFNEYTDTLKIDNKSFLISYCGAAGNQVNHEYDNKGNLVKLITDYYTVVYKFDNKKARFSELNKSDFPKWCWAFLDGNLNSNSGENNCIEAFRSFYTANRDINSHTSKVYNKYIVNKSGYGTFDDYLLTLKYEYDELGYPIKVFELGYEGHQRDLYLEYKIKYK